jgi:ATP-binding protein involved in chromosome partitioning
MSRTRCFSTLSRFYNEGLTQKGAPPVFPRRQKGIPAKKRLDNVKKIIAVSSAKGGVGKSTVAVNLAVAFARKGLRSGILDTDIFGPSIPTLLNLSGEPLLSDTNKLLPLTNYGVKSMSIGYLTPPGAPIVWRGLLLTKALQDLLWNVDWGTLDILTLDLPPGTGDVQLTITQQLELDGAVVVSTPQSLALVDSVRGINLFKKVDVPLLGMVGNMSTYFCSKCGHEEHVFGKEGVRRTCEEWGVPFLGDIPLHPDINRDTDGGRPTVAADPNSARAKAFEEIADKLAIQLGI